MRQVVFVATAILVAAQLSLVQAFELAKPVLNVRPSVSQVASPLFQEPRTQSSSLSHRIHRSLSSQSEWPRRKSLRIIERLGKIRKSVISLALSLFLAFGMIRTEPAVAASTAATPQDSLERMVDEYVQKHMFDDDVYEPVESIYREAITDKTQGTHQKALREITSSVLGQDGVKLEKSSSSSGIGDILLKAVGFLQRKGLSESMSIIVLTGSFVVAGPAAFLIGGMMVGSQSKRQINSVMKKRYGDTYTVDATVKVEEDVEVPDEDEDDDEDDDEDEDDEDDDDED